MDTQLPPAPVERPVRKRTPQGEEDGGHARLHLEPRAVPSWVSQAARGPPCNTPFSGLGAWAQAGLIALSPGLQRGPAWPAPPRVEGLRVGGRRQDPSPTCPRGWCKQQQGSDWALSHSVPSPARWPWWPWWPSGDGSRSSLLSQAREGQRLWAGRAAPVARSSFSMARALGRRAGQQRGGRGPSRNSGQAPLLLTSPHGLSCGARLLFRPWAAGLPPTFAPHCPSLCRPLLGSDQPGPPRQAHLLVFPALACQLCLHRTRPGPRAAGCLPAPGRTAPPSTACH